MVTNAVGELGEKPQYGGTVTIAISSDTAGFDRGIVGSSNVPQHYLTHDQGVEGDWTLSAAGTGELVFQYGEQSVTNYETMVGIVLSEWLDWPDPQTAIFHVNQDARWPNIPPMNGRPINAEDVAFSIERWFYLPTAPGTLAWKDVARRPQNIEVIDEYTMKWTNPEFRDKLTMSNTTWVVMLPKDSVELHGDQTDWRNAVGGPFIVSDYVSGSSISMTRLSDYWRMHPLYPDMRMPFVDNVVMLVIADASTRIAALRTAKIDVLQGVSLDDYESLMASNPELKSSKYLPLGWSSVMMRVDKPDLPWYDKKVRHALQMAIDRDAIAQKLYKGEASIYEWPVRSEGTFEKLFTPMNELPASVQELFKYQPQKAKQLLADAGFPNGFKANIIARTKDVDMLSIIKGYWAAIGVDLTLDVKEAGVFRGIQLGRTHEEMIVNDISGRYVQVMDPWLPGGWQNGTFIDTPETKEHIDTVLADFSSLDKLGTAYAKFTPYILDMAGTVNPPGPYQFALWWPWLRDFNGEFSVGQWNRHEAYKYIWVDQEMKEEMTK